MKGTITPDSGQRTEATMVLDPLSNEYYFIVPEKCTECKGIFTINLSAELYVRIRQVLLYWTDLHGSQMKSS
jgi:hypothetical protein